MDNQSIKYLGVGVNYRGEIAEDILAAIDKIDFVEVYTEKFFIKDDDKTLDAIIRQVPLVLHGLDLSVGSSSLDIDSEYKKNLVKALGSLEYEWFSDHLSLTKEEGIEVGHLMPVQFSEETIERVIKKSREIAAFSNKPFLLENITYYYPIPGSNIEEHDFISKILQGTDCGMLLDLNNLYINSKNHGYDPLAFLQKLPLERVVEIHLAGGSFKYGMLVDTHANNISEEVWNLLDYTCKIAPIKGVIIERDSNLDDYNDLLYEVNRAKDILKKNGVGA